MIMMSIFFCSWSVLGRDGQPITYFDKESGKSRLKRFTKTYRDYTRNGALAQFRAEHRDELDSIVKVNCEKVRA
jgi:hypothetical protein